MAHCEKCQKYEDCRTGSGLVWPCGSYVEKEPKPLTPAQQAKIIEKACKLANLGTHVAEIKNKRDACTWADRIAYQHKNERETMPVKKSYVYCDTLDMTFYFLRGTTPAVAYAGYTTAMSKDATGGLVNAFAKANEVLRYMYELMPKEGADHGGAADQSTGG